MRSRAVIAIAVVLAVAAGLVWQPPAASGQTKQLKIGVIFDQTGPLAGGGSLAGHYGTKYAIDIINERGGVEGYKIVPVYADAQSKVEVAVNEGERLINEQKVDMLMGVFSSAECVPLSAKVEAAKKFCGRTYVSPPPCSATRTCSTSSDPTSTRICTARRPATCWPSSPSPSSARSPRT